MDWFLYDKDLRHETVNDVWEKVIERVSATSNSTDVIFSLFTKIIFFVDFILSEIKSFDSVPKLPVIGNFHLTLMPLSLESIDIF